MALHMKGPMVSALVALALTGVGAVGTAHAAAPANSGTAIVAEQPGTPHGKFQRRFKTREECERDAERSFPGRRGDWNCQQGTDRANPWEMWSR